MSFNTTIKITDAEFKKLGGLIYDNFGINLSDEKRQLLEGRFQSILKKYNLASFKDYYEFLHQDRSQKISRLGELVDKISTNHTFFYREPKHFQLMEKEWLPELIKANATSKKLRIWCGAASTGEEPYTLLSILLKVLGPNYPSWDTGVIATDISSQALAKANAGIYEPEHVEELPKDLIRPIFNLDKALGKYKVKESVRSEILFRRFNLMNTLPFKGKFDIVFCRNVMIYFDKPTTMALVERIYDSVNPGGYLIISLSESLMRDQTRFKYISPGVYKKD